MKKVLLFVIVAMTFSGCAAHGKFRLAEPVAGESYVILYGKEGCSACQKFKLALDKEEVPYTFKDIADANIENEMERRMEKAGLDTRDYSYPVVDVNGELASYPSLRDTLKRYRRSARAS